MSKKIDYNQIGSVLRSKATQELADAISKEMNVPDRPLNISELTSATQGMSWIKPSEPETVERDDLGKEIDAFDAIYGDIE
jgi:hypothetical protein